MSGNQVWRVKGELNHRISCITVDVDALISSHRTKTTAL